MTSAPNPPDALAKSQGKPRFSLRTLFNIVTALAIVIASGTWCVNRYATYSSRTTFWFDMRFVLIHLQGYGGKSRPLPAPSWRLAANPPSASQDKLLQGQPLASWRFNLMRDFDEFFTMDYSQPWDSPKNSQCAVRPSAIFCDDDEFDGLPASRGVLQTEILAITGPGTAWGDDESEPPRALADVPEDTILIVSVRNSGVHWMEPGDFDIRTMPRTLNAPDGKGISSDFRDGFFVGFADGEAWFLANEVGFERLSRFFTVAGAREHDREEELGPFRRGGR